MKRTLASLVAAAALGTSVLFGNSAIAKDLKVGDKMPEPRGRYVFIEMGESLVIKDNLAARQHSSWNIPTLVFDYLLRPYRKTQDNHTNYFDFDLLVRIRGTNKIYKRMVLLSDSKEKDSYTMYQDCSPDGSIDLISKVQFDYNSVPKLNIPKFSCNIITLTDFPPVDQKTDSVSYDLKSKR